MFLRSVLAGYDMQVHHHNHPKSGAWANSQGQGMLQLQTSNPSPDTLQPGMLFVIFVRCTGIILGLISPF